MEMEVEKEAPPAYTHHKPESLVLPAVPTHELPSSSTDHAAIKLPDLKSLGLPSSRAQSQHPTTYHTQPQWPVQQPSSHHSYQYASSVLPPPSPLATESVLSDESKYRASSHMSIDDPDAREAAEALTGLRNMVPKHSEHRSTSSASSNTYTYHTLPPAREDLQIKLVEPSSENPHQEPLLSLITSSHPWIGGTISTSMYAYNSTMHYSPAFIQSIIERNVNAVAGGLGAVSRVTGVESRVRQYLGELPDKHKPGSHKRQREGSPDAEDVEMGLASPPSRQRSRTSSQASFPETLPAYDGERAPEYEKQPQLATMRRPSQQAWGTRLLVTTSGLGVALSDASLRSLKFCLGILHRATGHLSEVMVALKNLLAEYESVVYGMQPESSQRRSKATLTPDQQAAADAIAERIKALGGDIMATLQAVTSNVSRYTGGALPENAAALVRRQLLSVPRRWKVAEEAGGPSSEKDGNDAIGTGQRLLVFAEQGCDMIAQVGIVLGGTVDSAEKWLDSMGRRRASVASSDRKSPAAGGNSRYPVDRIDEKEEMSDVQMQ